MTRDTTTRSSLLEQPEAGTEPVRPDRTRLGIVVVLLAVQVVVALVAFADARPARYGWQMYSAMPARVGAWSMRNGEELRLHIEARFIYNRAEIDRAAVVRDYGCNLFHAEAIRLELPDGSTETVPCR